MTIFRDDLVLLLPNLRAFARSLTAGDRHLVDDLVQDTMVNALRGQHQFTPGTDLKAWLFTILRNRFLSVVTRKHVTAEVQVDDLDQKRSTPATQEAGIEVACSAGGQVEFHHNGYLSFCHAAAAGGAASFLTCGRSSTQCQSKARVAFDLDGYLEYCS